MAKNWTAYEAAKEIVEGKNKENICEIGSRYPMLTREVAVAGDKILVILKALPKVTARVLETGLKDGVEMNEPEEVEEETKETESEEEDFDYTDMTAANLYKMCCARGISSKCKSRKKDALIEILEKFDRGELDEEEPKKAKATSKKSAKKAEPAKKAAQEKKTEAVKKTVEKKPEVTKKVTKEEAPETKKDTPKKEDIKVTKQTTEKEEEQPKKRTSKTRRTKKNNDQGVK